jgi:Pilus formation protein N terminal region
MGLVFGRLLLALIFAFCAVAAIAPKSAPAAEVRVSVDEAKLIKLPENVATIVVGNPLIADASLQPGGIMVLTGKGYGVTNLMALDRTGAVLMERSIEVQGPHEQTVVVHRGASRETYSCTPYCDPRITLGDANFFFNATINQTATRNSFAQIPPPTR